MVICIFIIVRLNLTILNEGFTHGLEFLFKIPNQFLIDMKSHEIICGPVIDILYKDQVNFESYSVLHLRVSYFYIYVLDTFLLTVVS